MMKKFRNIPLITMAGFLLGIPSSSATILVTEPFDYNVGIWTQSGTDWTTNMGSGSGIGWGTNNWFSHLSSDLKFGIATGGHTGTFADSTGMNNVSNSWRERKMTPVHGNSDGAVTWQYLTVSVTGIGTAAQLTTQNENGGGDFAVRIMTDGTYALSAEHQNVKTATSTIAASLDATAPDIVVVKMENQTGTGLFNVSMWVNPISPTSVGLPAPDLQILGAAAFSNNRNIGSINWMPGKSQIDNFTLASTYEDFDIGTVISGPFIGVKDGNIILTDNSSVPVAFGPTPEGHALVKTFTVTNGGTADLTLTTINVDGTDASDFVVAVPDTSTVAPGTSATFVVTFTPATAGAKSAAIHIFSDTPGDLNPFDIALTGTGLSFTADTDGDGLSDAAEFNLAALGFDWQESQVDMVHALFANASGVGLYTSDEIQAQNAGNSLLHKDLATGQFKLTLGVLKSTDLGHFTSLPMTSPQTGINANGEIEFTFDSDENAAFFRVEAK